MSRLVRKIEKRPSVFQILDDPEAQSTLLEAAALELDPGHLDFGWASYWETSSEREENRVKAFLAAKRNHPYRLDVLRIPRGVVEESGTEVREDTDPQAYDCISNLHRLLNLGSSESRRRLVMRILGALESGQLQENEIYQRIKKNDILPFLEEVYAECVALTGGLDISRSAGWAREHFANRQPSTDPDRE